jgi:3,4-dihydroxyphenylacetate 2,3-dioxygenase
MRGWRRDNESELTMGEIVGAALCGHVPTVMLPEETRVRLGGGQDTSLVAGFGRVREAIAAAGADTLVIFDTHWFSTTEHLVDGRAWHRGVYTSEELPRVIHDLAYDFEGAPALAVAVEKAGRERGVRVVNVTSEHVARHYPTLNLVEHLRREERVLSVAICQTAEVQDFLEFGAVIAEGVRASEARVVLLASGGMSHSFWPLREVAKHSGFEPEHVRTPLAREMDEKILGLWAGGDHASVIDLYPEYCAVSPEGMFGHYLMLAGALGGRACTARGRQLSNYESSLGTGQVHVWFEVLSAEC